MGKISSKKSISANGNSASGKLPYNTINIQGLDKNMETPVRCDKISTNVSVKQNRHKEFILKRDLDVI